MAITWVETVPSPSSAASSADDELRAFMVAVASGVSRSFVWPGSGGGSATGAGVSVAGNARLAVATNSAVTGGYNDGFLLLNQTHESLHHIGSTWTAMLGHSSMVDHLPSNGFTAASLISAHWTTSTGTFLITGSTNFGTHSVSFATPYATTPPFVVLSQLAASAVSLFALHVSSVSTGGFTSVYSGLAATLPDTVILWESNGTVLV